MTKRRAPLSPHQALMTIAAAIGFPEIQQITGRQERAIRLWTDPDIKTSLTLDHAIALDVAYLAAGGLGAPLLDSYAAEIKRRQHRAGRNLIRLASSLGKAAKEMGDAIAAGLRALAPGAGPDALAVAEFETEEAVAAATRALEDIRACRHSGDEETAHPMSTTIPEAK